MRGGKYANKTPAKRFFHKYTGSIVLFILITIILIVWIWNGTTQVFFEGWNCEQIKELGLEGLTVRELERWVEIAGECQDEQFTPEFTP